MFHLISWSCIRNYVMFTHSHVMDILSAVKDSNLDTCGLCYVPSNTVSLDSRHTVDVQGLYINVAGSRMESVE